MKGSAVRILPTLQIFRGSGNEIPKALSTKVRKKDRNLKGKKQSCGRVIPEIETEKRKMTSFELRPSGGNLFNK